MGSLNDYSREDLYREPRGRVSWKWRLLRQTVLAALLFFVVAASVGADGPLGRVSRYLAGPGLAAESSWIAWDNGLAQVEAPLQSEFDADAVDIDGSAVDVDGNAVEIDGSAVDVDNANAVDAVDGATDGSGTQDAPQFTAPASGVVVTELAVASTGFASRQGILIRGSEGQRVRAAAEGSVLSLSSDANGYLVELSHAAGYSSVYQGLSDIEVAVGDQVSLGQSIGQSNSGELTFSLLKDGSELDPLQYLFN